MRRLAIILILMICGSCWSQNDFTTDANCVVVWDGEYDGEWIEADWNSRSTWGQTDTEFSGTTVTVLNQQTRRDTVYIYKDFGADYFSGDFSHRFIVNASAFDNSIHSYPAQWMVGNAVGDEYALSTSVDVQMFRFYEATDTVYGMQVLIYEDGSQADEDQFTSPLLNTDYYVTIDRDDDGGANNTGQLTVYICTTNYYGEAGASLQDTLTVDSSAGEQNDFRYLYVYASLNDGGATDPESDMKMWGHQIEGVAISPNFNSQYPVDSISSQLPYNNFGALPSASVYQRGSYSIDFTTNGYDGVLYYDANLPVGWPLEDDTGDELSVVCWFRMDDVPTTTTYEQMIVGDWYLGSTIDLATWKVSVSTNDKVMFSTRDSAERNYELNHTLYADTWYHVGVTYNDSTSAYVIRLYDTIDTTVYATSGSVNGATDRQTQPVTLGCSAYATFETIGTTRLSFDGYLDEVVVFNDILTADEIDEIRGGTFGGSTGAVNNWWWRRRHNN